ncbi:MAG: nucleotidyl transferase AbiEii/AbiGii toxin family protein [Clostridia bacterium]|nr:nucleotidyl transferase AbiEii/AbiGii toxin family protein [Clostridia bacterium]
MEFSRQYLVALATKTNFIRDTLEKVLRLSEILKFLNSDVVFKGKLALKGGTAINLTAVELPRLSVDIDLDFTENIPRDELLLVKERFSKRLTDYMWQEGYSVADIRDSFALMSFLFNYVNSAGNRDNIKIEINFMDRCHILPLENKIILTKGIVDDFEVLTLNTVELYASKINALLSRATPRDLYDVNAMIENGVIAEEDKEMLRNRCGFIARRRPIVIDRKGY